MANQATLGPVRVWTLAAGGMVGGGIYVALGVVIAASAQWAWLSFVVAGIVAVATAWSYARLSVKFGKSGGAFEFLEELDHAGLAGSLSWLLLIGYTLTISVYAYAFGHYVAYAFDGGAWAIRGIAIGGGVALIGLNLAGLGKMTIVEVVIVTGNLLVLIGLAAFGLAHWNVAELSAGIEPGGPGGALVGAAAIFVSYEGFQLLTYEYDEVRDGKRLFVPMFVSAAIVVVAIYVAVALGATMLTGARTMIQGKEVALSIAAIRGWGTIGLVALTIAAGFATSAAINSTLFSSGQLAARVAEKGELGAWLDHRNRFDVPDRAVVLIGAVALALASIGSLSSLVEAASLVFLATFVVVNLICWREVGAGRWIALVGIALGGVIGVILIARLALTATLPLALLVVVVLLVFAVRAKRWRGGAS